MLRVASTTGSRIAPRVSPSNRLALLRLPATGVREERGAMAEESGLEESDRGALSIEQQEKLRVFKIDTRLANELYLRAHPEVEMLLSHFLSAVFLKKPIDIGEFAADHFSDPNLPEIIQMKLEQKASVKIRGVQ